MYRRSGNFRQNISSIKFSLVKFLSGFIFVGFYFHRVLFSSGFIFVGFYFCRYNHLTKLNSLYLLVEQNISSGLIFAVEGDGRRFVHDENFLIYGMWYVCMCMIVRVKYAVGA